MLSKGSVETVANRNMNPAASASIRIQKSFVYLITKWKNELSLGGFDLLSPK